MPDLPTPWGPQVRRAGALLLYGWLPAGIGWQLAHADRLDAVGMLGWFLWPAVPAGYLAATAVRKRHRARGG